MKTARIVWSRPTMPNRGATETALPAAPASVSGGTMDVALSITDEALLERVRSGDAASGDALVRRYAQPLLRYLQRLVGNDQAEELHQQTWLSVLDNLEKFDPGGGGGAATSETREGRPVASPFKAWLFRIATNKAHDLWRSRGREKVAKERLRLVQDEAAPWAGERAEGAEQQQKLLRAIERLPESQRQVLALRYYSNMKFVDIASLLGCPLNTALGRVHKAMLKLRQLMEEG